MSFRRNLNAAKSFSKDNEATFRNAIKFADVIDSFETTYSKKLKENPGIIRKLDRQYQQFQSQAVVNKLSDTSRAHKDDILKTVADLDSSVLKPLVKTINKINSSDLPTLLKSIQEIPKTELKPVLDAIKSIPKADYSEVLSAIQNIPSTDLSDVLSSIEGISEDTRVKVVSSLIDPIDSTLTKVTDIQEQVSGNISVDLSSVITAIEGIPEADLDLSSVFTAISNIPAVDLSGVLTAIDGVPDATSTKVVSSLIDPLDSISTKLDEITGAINNINCSEPVSDLEQAVDEFESFATSRFQNDMTVTPEEYGDILDQYALHKGKHTVLAQWWPEVSQSSPDEFQLWNRFHRTYEFAYSLYL